MCIFISSVRRRKISIKNCETGKDSPICVSKVIRTSIFEAIKVTHNSNRARRESEKPEKHGEWVVLRKSRGKP